ncbi:MAG: GTP-binding protein [Methanimicrococcus sp.]|nr:GTP-binding protein [Methanimicrococcus sp.]
MKVFIIGGFLGSGKTTTVLKLIKKMAADNKRAALIVNEVGEIGIDGSALEVAGIPSKEITNGCICCSLIYSLRVTVSELADIYKPDILIVEPTGLSFPSQIRDELLRINVMMSFAPIITLVDVSRFTSEMNQIPKFVEQQLKEADIIGINKTDLADEEKIQAVETFLKEMNPDAYQIRMSARENESVDKLYRLMMAEGETVFNPIDAGGAEARSIVTEKANSIEVSNISAYSGLYHAHAQGGQGKQEGQGRQEGQGSQEGQGRQEGQGGLTVKDAGALLEQIVTTAGIEIAKLNSSFVGHIKMAVKVDDTLIKVSQTAGPDDRQIEAEYILQEKIENNGEYELRYLSAVTNVKKAALEEIANNAISAALTAKNLTFKKQASEGDLKKPILL